MQAKKKTAAAEQACEARHVPRFDEKAAIGLDNQEVADRWPRNPEGARCLACGAPLYSFKNHAHMIAGGWV